MRSNFGAEYTCSYQAVIMLLIHARLHRLHDASAEDHGGWTEFLKQYPEVDESRTAGWGASWGGYAIKCVLRLRWPAGARD
jgi:hypothetical protein